MARGLTDPLLERLDFADKVFAEFGATGYGRQQTIARREREKHEGLLSRERSLAARAVAPLQGWAERVREELCSLTLPLKAGLAASLCSLLCYIPGFLNKNGLWAVITADLVLEHTVGLTFIRGINRTLGTMAASAMALLVNYMAPKFGGGEPYIVAAAVFLGAVVATMFKFRRPFKDRWNYAVAMSMITFHILILSKNDYEDKIRLPLIRLVDIVVGFFVASLVALTIVPEYAGSTVNELLGRNFERAGNVMERCVNAYCDGTVLEQVHELLQGKGEDDNIFLSFHEIVSADSEVDKLMKTVPYEPAHGKFFCGYPWGMYNDITEHLRYTLYDVLALDSCLRAEIQAPMHLREMFEDDLRVIGAECGQVFRLIGLSIREMRHVKFGEPRRRAEEAALLLQHKVAKFTTILLVGDPSEKEDLEDRYHLGEDRERDNLHTPRTDRADSQRSTTDSVPSTPRRRVARLADGHEDFMQRQGSMGRHREETVQRISNLSLIKFAALLMELLAKAKYVVGMVDELEIKARFAEDPSCPAADPGPTSSKDGGYGRPQHV